jgi:hypothetical protein
MHFAKNLHKSSRCPKITRSSISQTPPFAFDEDLAANDGALTYDGIGLDGFRRAAGYAVRTPSPNVAPARPGLLDGTGRSGGAAGTELAFFELERENVDQA